MSRVVVAVLFGAWLGALPVARACLAVLLPPSSARLELVSVEEPGGSTSEVDRWAESGTWTEGEEHGTGTLELSDGTTLHVGLR